MLVKGFGLGVMGARMGLGLKMMWKGVVEENWKLNQKAEKGGDEDVCWGRGEDWAR